MRKRMNKGLEDLVDLMFDIDIEEVMKEKSTVEYIHKLQQENKQLKEELERSMKANIVLDNTNTDYASIIFELEEWLNLEIAIHNEDDTIDTLYSCVLDKIQKLKEKYK